MLCSSAGTNGAAPQIFVPSMQPFQCCVQQQLKSHSWQLQSSAESPHPDIFKLPCTEQHNLLKKRNISIFAFCFINVPNIFLSPLLFLTPLFCLCHWGACPHVPIIWDSLPGPTNPSAVPVCHNSHFVNNHNCHTHIHFSPSHRSGRIPSWEGIRREVEISKLVQ